MELNVHLFDKICRTCLSQTTELKSLIPNSEDNLLLLDRLCFTTNITIDLDDIFPKQVCTDCESNLNRANMFKQRCIESEKILKKIYEDYTNAGNFGEVESKFIAKVENEDSKHRILMLETIATVECEFEQVFDAKNEEFAHLSFYPNNHENITETAGIPGVENTRTINNTIKDEFSNDFPDKNSFGSDFEDSNLDTMSVTQPEEMSADGKKVVTCQCGLVFNEHEAYRFHLTITKCDHIFKTRNKCPKRGDIKKEITCLRCNKQFKNTSSFRSHYLYNCEEDSTNTDKSEGFLKYQCSLCLLKYKSKKTLASHIRRHHKTPRLPHTCKQCKREFKYKAFLDNHIVTVHINNEVTCEYCRKQCHNVEELEKHREEHMEKKHQCTICKKAFSMLCTLKDHLRTHTGEKPFLCSFCGKGFSQKNNLQQHLRRHQGYKPFNCDSCEKRFVSKGELDAHQRKHSGAHPFICVDCGNGFTTASSLAKHRRIHTGERPYQCDLCPMRFSASGTLKNHRRTHTGERPYQCSHCEKAFVQRNDLVSHIRCHTGERPFACHHCGQGFRKATALKAHIKIHCKRDTELGGVASLPQMQ